MKPTPAAFDALKKDLDPYFVNRSGEMDTSILALVARCHVFLLSEPGTAKSMLIKEIVKRIGDVRSFLVMLNKFADDSLLYGPASIAGLREGKRIREAVGYLPYAEILFADEIWKASSALVNTMLQALNERVWFDDGQEKPLPLWTMFSASNELPQQEHEELAAIWDRTGLRRVVPALTDRSDLRRLLELPTPPENPDPVISWGDVVGAHRDAMTLELTPDSREGFLDIVTRCHAIGVPVPSGRRMREAERIAKANAWLSGADKVEVEHFDYLVDYLWEDPDQRGEIGRIVYDVAAPMRAEALELADDVANLLLAIMAATSLDANDPARSSQALDLAKKVKRAAVSAADLERRVTGRAAGDVNDTFSRIEGLWDTVQLDLFGLSAAQATNARIEARSGEWDATPRRRRP